MIYATYLRAGILAGLLCSIIALSGCAGGSVAETHKAMQGLRVASVQSSEEASVIPVPENIRNRFQLQLDEALYIDKHFPRGNQLTIKWQMVAFDEGSRALRYFVGFGAGKGKIMVRARFLDQRAQEVAAIQSEGSITIGAFGGSYETALSECADEIARYARDNFLSAAR